MHWAQPTCYTAAPQYVFDPLLLCGFIYGFVGPQLLCVFWGADATEFIAFFGDQKLNNFLFIEVEGSSRVAVRTTHEHNERCVRIHALGARARSYSCLMYEVLIGLEVKGRGLQDGMGVENSQVDR